MIIAVAVAVFVIVESTKTTKTTTNLNATLRVVPLSQTGGRLTTVGTVSGNPDGGSEEIDHIFAAALKPGGAPVQMTAKAFSRFDNGSFNSTIQGTATPNKNGSTTITGKGQVTDGQNHFKNATGSYTFSGTLPKQGAGVFTIKGKITSEK